MRLHCRMGILSVNVRWRRSRQRVIIGTLPFERPAWHAFLPRQSVTQTVGPLT